MVHLFDATFLNLFGATFSMCIPIYFFSLSVVIATNNTKCTTNRVARKWLGGAQQECKYCYVQ